MEPTTGEAPSGSATDSRVGTVGTFDEEFVKWSVDWLSKRIADARAGPNWLSPPFQMGGRFYGRDDGAPRLIARCLVVARAKLGEPNESELAADSFWAANPGLVERLALQRPPSFYFEGEISPAPASGENPRHFRVIPREVCLYEPGDLRPSGDGKYSITVFISFVHARSLEAEEGTRLGASQFYFTGLEAGNENACTRAPPGTWNMLPPNSEEGSLGLVNIEIVVSETGADSSLFQVIEREAKAIARSFGDLWPI